MWGIETTPTFFRPWVMSYLRSAGMEYGGKVAYCMPQIDVNKGAGYSKMIRKRIMLCFWMKAFTSRDMDLTASSGELHLQATFHSNLRQAGRTGVGG